MLALSELFERLKSSAAALGLRVSVGKDELSGELEAIRSRWLLGARKVSYRMSCRLVAGDKTVYFREVVAERSRGLPPPVFSFGTTAIKGRELSGQRTERSPAGGGTIDFARVRDELRQVVTAAGWQFKLEGGRMPIMAS